MKIHLKSLRLVFRNSTEIIDFTNINIFWGKIGAGKSSIARLVDYCFGGNISLTYALQSEFLEAALFLEIGDQEVAFYRKRESSSITALWTDGNEAVQAILPARRPSGELAPDMPLEVLSDLIFHLAELPIVRVRRNRRGGNRQLERLSFRDLYLFCYLDQDHIDSDFFRLDSFADFRRAKSVDAMRLLLGYHQDRVAEMENNLQDIQDRRRAIKEAAAALKLALKDAGLSSITEIDSRIESLRAKALIIRNNSLQLRIQQEENDTKHAVDNLRDKARELSHRIQELEQQADGVATRLRETTSLANELKMLSIRYSRTKSARSVLAAVDFQDCPKCNLTLPSRLHHLCQVCGQHETEDSAIHEHMSESILQNDLRSRLKELQETHAGLEIQRGRTAQRLESSKREKAQIDHSLNERLREYDSAFVSRAVEMERQATTVEQRVNALLTFKKIPEQLDVYFDEAEQLLSIEKDLKHKLNIARAEAFKDVENIKKLEYLFLDCLLRSKFPGVTSSYIVEIDRRTFLPRVMAYGEEDIAVTSFANMGSGGMKCIFKACFAVALHRLLADRNTALPSLLIIDSAMKNLSERENWEIFESFFSMIYELAATELSNTQIIIIDKEFFSPTDEYAVPWQQRHMLPSSAESPPLIPYYRISKPDSSDDNLNIK